ncbi:MAG: hypothetical protein E4H27_01190 [Anaerolineales bacterium]|nr:MAG: hypothetical protein E4H27_01190 [Anaerolineales bacterium]
MPSRKYLLITWGLLLILITASSCATPTTVSEIAPAQTVMPTSTPANPKATPEPRSTDTIAPEPTAKSASTPEPTATVEESTWAADGVIMAEEYTYQEGFSDLRLWWKNDGGQLVLD